MSRRIEEHIEVENIPLAGFIVREKHRHMTIDAGYFEKILENANEEGISIKIKTPYLMGFMFQCKVVDFRPSGGVFKVFSNELTKDALDYIRRKMQ